MIGEQRGLCEEQKKPLNNHLFCKTNEETYSREEKEPVWLVDRHHCRAV
jgi:hypothetical protein